MTVTKGGISASVPSTKYDKSLSKQLILQYLDDRFRYCAQVLANAKTQTDSWK